MKIRPVGAELFHADGRTDMMKLKVSFPILGTGLKIAAGHRCTEFPLKTHCEAKEHGSDFSKNETERRHTEGSHINFSDVIHRPATKYTPSTLNRSFTLIQETAPSVPACRMLSVCHGLANKAQEARQTVQSGSTVKHSRVFWGVKLCRSIRACRTFRKHVVPLPAPLLLLLLFLLLILFFLLLLLLLLFILILLLLPFSSFSSSSSSYISSSFFLLLLFSFSSTPASASPSHPPTPFLLLLFLLLLQLLLLLLLLLLLILLNIFSSSSFSCFFSFSSSSSFFSFPPSSPPPTSPSPHSFLVLLILLFSLSSPPSPPPHPPAFSSSTPPASSSFPSHPPSSPPPLSPHASPSPHPPSFLLLPSFFLIFRGWKPLKRRETRSDTT